MSATDIMIGSQGNGMAHLLWQPFGCGVLEIFPHYRSYDNGVLQEEGTGWTNDWPFLTRLKGCVYRSVDSELGAQSPVRHAINDNGHQLHVGDLVLNEEATVAEFMALLEEWKKVKTALLAGEEGRMREHWHPAYTSEAAWA